MMYASIEALRDGIGAVGADDPAWHDKMVHPIPATTVVERVPWLLEQCKGKVVLHLGSLAPLHAELRKVCKKLYGVDRVSRMEADYYCVDLDQAPDALPILPDVEVILAGEVLEHLANPGWLLAMLRESYGCPLVITVPNAFCPQVRLQKGIELVNREHVAWYSYATLKALVERYGYQVQEWYWYHGQPLTAEGLIFVCKGEGVSVGVLPPSASPPSALPPSALPLSEVMSAVNPIMQGINYLRRTLPA